MKKILFAISLGCCALPAAAQWVSDPAINNAVCTTSPTTAKTGNTAVSDGAGGMYLAWIDSRTSSNQSIYVQRILPNGNNAFAAEVLVTEAAGAVSSSKTSLSIAPDGAGGVLLAWQDTRNYTTGPANSNNDIYGQRINAAGTALWSTDGVRLTVSDNTVSQKIAPSIVAVNATEAMLIFGDNRDGTSDVHAQKISLASGAPLWAADLSVHGAQPGTQTSTSIMEDSTGGAFILWQDPRLATTNSDIYMQRVSNAGGLLWGAGGTVICDAANNQLTPLMVADGKGGAAVTWTDNRVALADGDIFAQRINSAGAVQWAANGTAVCIQAGSNQSNPNIVAGGSGFIITWSDPRVAISNRNIYSNSVDSLTGAAVWTTAAAGGVAVVTATGNQPGSSTQSGMTLLSDGNNGAYVIWDDPRAGTTAYDIFAQRMSPAGVALWLPDGLFVTSAAANQQGPVAVNDLSNNAIVAWRDSRSGTTNSQLFATLLQPAGVLPVSFTKVNASLSANNFATIRWETASEINSDLYLVERSENGSTFYTIATTAAKNQSLNNYAVIDSKPVTSTSFYRVRSVDKAGKLQYSEVIKLATASKEVYVQIYPNPVKDLVNLECNNLTSGTYLLRIHDSKGAIVLQRQLALQQGSTRIPLNLGQLSGGSYFVQLIGENKKTVTTLTLQKQ